MESIPELTPFDRADRPAFTQIVFLLQVDVLSADTVQVRWKCGFRLKFWMEDRLKPPGRAMLLS